MKAVRTTLKDGLSEFIMQVGSMFNIDPQRALRMIASKLKKRPDVLALYFMGADYALMVGNEKLGIDYTCMFLDTQLKMTTKSPEKILSSIGILMDHGQYDSVCQYIPTLFNEKTMIGIEPRSLYSLSKKLLIAGKPAEAAILAGWLTTKRQEVSDLELLTKCLLESDEPIVAEIVIKRFLKTGLNKPPQMALLARILMRQGRHEEAESIIKQALEIEPMNDYLSTLLAETLRKQRRYQEAIAVIDWMNGSYKHPSTVLCVAYCHMNIGNYAESMKLLLRTEDVIANWQGDEIFTPKFRLHCGYLFLYERVAATQGASQELLNKADSAFEWLKRHKDRAGTFQHKDVQAALLIAETLL